MESSHFFPGYILSLQKKQNLVRTKIKTLNIYTDLGMGKENLLEVFPSITCELTFNISKDKFSVRTNEDQIEDHSNCNNRTANLIEECILHQKH